MQPITENKNATNASNNQIEQTNKQTNNQNQEYAQYSD